MDSIRIDAGIKRVMINDDPDRVLEFNPSDVGWVERFYSLIGDFEAQQEAFERRAEAVDADDAVDQLGLPANAGARLQFMRDLVGYMHDKIDGLFGDGTAQMLFGEAMSIEMVLQFFEGITPHIASERESRVERYTQKGSGKRRAMK